MEQGSNLRQLKFLQRVICFDTNSSLFRLSKARSVMVIFLVTLANRFTNIASKSANIFTESFSSLAYHSKVLAVKLLTNYRKCKASLPPVFPRSPGHAAAAGESCNYQSGLSPPRDSARSRQCPQNVAALVQQHKHQSGSPIDQTSQSTDQPVSAGGEEQDQKREREREPPPLQPPEVPQGEDEYCEGASIHIGGQGCEGRVNTKVCEKFSKKLGIERESKNQNEAKGGVSEKIHYQIKKQETHGPTVLKLDSFLKLSLLSKLYMKMNILVDAQEKHSCHELLKWRITPSERKQIHSDGSSSDFFIDKVLGENIKKELSRIQSELSATNQNMNFSDDQIEAISMKLPVDKADLNKFFPKSWCSTYGDIVLDVVKKEFKDHVGEMENLRNASKAKHDNCFDGNWVSFEDESENFHPNLFSQIQLSSNQQGVKDNPFIEVQEGVSASYLDDNYPFIEVHNPFLPPKWGN
ncbi:hypothetical protein KFK09_022996 [Dendrobium nobile]|uniref:Uncharacterized protein n=1 Tax=Dendrobium nobile TaxID=94219 RepID=A0A8T3ALG7_DENNO|nr:hypothetical protein KFK09_022996 [Dendrobium nobile]